MKEKNRTWGKWYLKGLAFLATGIFTSMAAGLSVMAQTELTFTEKLTIEEVRELSEPEKEYEDENGIRYELKDWELQEKEGEEITRTLEKRVEYPKVEAAEEVPEIILADETDPGWILLSGNLYRKNVEITGEQWKEDFSVPVTFYSYGADEYELGDLVIPAGEDQLLEKTAEAGDWILEDLGLSKDDYRITSLVWNGEPFSDENGQICREALALGKRLLRDYEVLYEGEVKWKEPDYYELHVIYQLEEPAKMTEEETTMEIKEDHTEKNDSPVKRQGPFWYLVRTGLMITVAIGILGLFIGLILLVVMKRRSRKDRS